jgi:hypothetical protein
LKHEKIEDKKGTENVPKEERIIEWFS